MGIPRAIRLDQSDTRNIERAAEPGDKLHTLLAVSARFPTTQSPSASGTSRQRGRPATREFGRSSRTIESAPSARGFAEWYRIWYHILMPGPDKLISRMRRNPRADWRIDQLKAIADYYGIAYRQPGTSHVTFAPEGARGLTVPAHKPIKPVYVRRFVAMIDAIGGDDGHQH